MTDNVEADRQAQQPLTQQQFETWATRLTGDLDRRLRQIEQRPQFLERTARAAQEEGRMYPVEERTPLVMREKAQRTRGLFTSEFLVTAVLGVGLLGFTGWMMWLWVSYPDADWAMLLNAVVIPAAAWLGKAYIDGRGEEKVERIRRGEQV